MPVGAGDVGGPGPLAGPADGARAGAGETGCWSGSVVVDAGVPVIVYTSVLADAPGMGRIALAEGDVGWRRWTPDPAGPVIPAPDPGLGFAHVRDPFVWREGDEWRMVVGAGSTDGRPSVLQYSSPRPAQLATGRRPRRARSRIGRGRAALSGSAPSSSASTAPGR